MLADSAILGEAVQGDQERHHLHNQPSRWQEPFPGKCQGVCVCLCMCQCIGLCVLLYVCVLPVCVSLCWSVSVSGCDSSVSETHCFADPDPGKNLHAEFFHV